MTVEATLFASLKDLVGNRVFPDVAPEDTARPYITYQQIGGEPVNFVDGGVPTKKNGRFQINVWANARLEAGALSRSVEDALRGLTALQTTVLGGCDALYEPESRLYGTRQDFSFWF